MPSNDVTVDASELVEFGFDLGRIASSALPRVDGIVKRAAQNVKDDMVSDARGSKHFRGIAPTIDYERAYGIGEVAYKVGPNRSRGGQAPLAGVAYTGGANGGGGSLDLEGPADREEPRMMKALLELLGDLG